jgi:glycerol-3-phosphate dehydrogenase (NAD(P)+)
MEKKISVIGSGAWGCALAQLLSLKGYDVKLWSWTKEESETIKKDRENKLCLEGVQLCEKITYTYSLKEAADADLYVLAVPSHAVFSTAKAFSEFAKEGVVIVNVAKGFEKNGLKRLSAVIEEHLKDNPVVVLSGPTHAEEVAVGIPSTIVAAARDIRHAQIVQDVFMSDTFRVYTHDDVIGVELGGALKNIIALCAGISDGLGLGDNTKAALMTRGLAEISRLGVAMGAKAQTFAGLTGVGDLIVTCTSMHSRNRRAGILIGKGYTAEEAQKEVKTVVEGIKATQAAYLLSKKYKVEMPITKAAYKVLFENMPPGEAVYSLMSRDKKSEADFF